MIRFAILEDARKFVSRWGGDPSSIENLGDSGNSVFSFKNSDGKLQILRFTDSEFRSFDEVTAELNFVNHLYGANIPVALSRLSIWACTFKKGSALFYDPSILIEGYPRTYMLNA